MSNKNIVILLKSFFALALLRDVQNPPDQGRPYTNIPDMSRLKV